MKKQKKKNAWAGVMILVIYLFVVVALQMFPESNAAKNLRDLAPLVAYSALFLNWRNY